MYSNDGNTATPSPEASISPVNAASTEDQDMIAKVKDYIDRGINALVNQSKLYEEVNQLRTDIAKMQESVDEVRRQNNWLDEQLVRVRTERDSANKQAQEAEMRMVSLADENQRFQSKLDTAMRLAGEDGLKIESLQKERDDAQMKVMELEDELSKVKAKIEKFLSLADEIDPPEEPHLATILHIPPTQESGPQPQAAEPQAAPMFRPSW